MEILFAIAEVSRYGEFRILQGGDRASRSWSEKAFTYFRGALPARMTGLRLRNSGGSGSSTSNVLLGRHASPVAALSRRIHLRGGQEGMSGKPLSSPSGRSRSTRVGRT